MKHRSPFKLLGSTLLALGLWHQAMAQTPEADGMAQFLKRATAMQSLVVCGDAKRATEPPGPRDDKDLKIVREGVAIGEWRCQLLMGYWLDAGSGVPKDSAAATQLWELASAKTGAAFEALANQAAQSGQQDTVVALLERATQHKLPAGELKLAALRMSADPDASLALIRRALRRGNLAAWDALYSVPDYATRGEPVERQRDQQVWFNALRTALSNAFKASPIEQKASGSWQITTPEGQGANTLTIQRLRFDGDEALATRIEEVLRGIKVPTPPPAMKARLVEVPFTFGAAAE